MTKPVKTVNEALPPDQAERERIVRRLDTTMLVEAAAGTGKTTCMIDRMVALLREGNCLIETLAAVTFTRKAAAELRARFQVELEKAVRSAEGEARRRLRQALSGIDRCFIGTIHSFCGRLLRERPVEAGVDLSFQELDETADVRLREQAWDLYVAALFARDDPILRELDELGVNGLLSSAGSILEELNELGLDVADLTRIFSSLANFSDVEEWPAEKVEMPDLAPVVKQIEEYVLHMSQLVPTFPRDRGNDELMTKFERLARLHRHVD